MYGIQIVSEKPKKLEKNKMKTIKNLILMFALSVTFAFGDDGHTGGGGRCDTCTPPPACTENCGGFAATQDPEVAIDPSTGTNDEETSMIDYWSNMFFELIG